MTNEQIYAAAWQSLCNVGAARIRKLISYFGSAEKAWNADKDKISAVIPFGPKKMEYLHQQKKEYDIEAFSLRLQSMHINITVISDDEYPILLKQTYNPPAVLFYQGILPDNEKNVAIVGSRKCTAYGRNAAIHFAENLAANNIIIVSGGARGIDTAAHTGALRNKKRTIAVTACGLDKTYPYENKKLFDAIVENGGALITEYAPGIEPLAQNFPARNRIISGMSKCAIIVEAGEKSGSLITADFALEDGRDVFAVPGSIFSSASIGTNHLLRIGAAPMTTASDVLDEYGWNNTELHDAYETVHVQLTLLENTLLSYIPYDKSIHQEDLIICTKLSAQEISRTLMLLLMKGCIIEDGNGQYIRRSKS